MKDIIQRFNALNGKKVTRKELSRLMLIAQKEKCSKVSLRIRIILDKFPDYDQFLVTIKDPIKLDNGLGAARHTGMEKDALDECGRLKPGYRYLKGGQVEKVEKKKTKKPGSTQEEQPVKTVPKNTEKKKASVIKKPEPQPKKIATQVFEKKTYAPEEWVKADTRKTTYLIKKYLKEKYGIEVRVKSDFFTGGSSLDIYYTMGTDPKVVESDLKRLQKGSFNGMEDIYEYADESEKGIILDGFMLQNYKYVSASREIPEKFKIRLAELFSEKYSIKGFKPFDGTIDDFYRYQETNFGNANKWSDLIYQLLNGQNFNIQDPDKITDLKLEGNLGYKESYLTYKLKGDPKLYDSRKPLVYETKMVKEKNIVKNQIRLIDYDKNHIAVIGMTGEIRDELTEIGGVPNKKISFDGKVHSGFVFHKKDIDQVSNILIEYSREDEPGLNGTFKRKPFKKKIVPGKRKGLGMPANIEVSEIIFQQPAPIQMPAFPEQVPVKKMVANTTVETKPATIPAIPSAIAKSKNPLVKSMAERSGSGEYYELPGGLGEFIGRIEKKPRESVVITLDAPQGSGKTRLLFQIMNLIASMGMRVLYLSFEEHPDSDLFTMKRDQYIDPANHDKIDTIAELPNGYADFKSLVPEYDWIFTDSFGKKELLCGGRFDLDKDQRKAFDGKVFVDIYQRTQDGKMRGGSVAQFDADAVMKIDKDPSGNYKNNIAFFDKHRYQTRPLNEMRYNIFHQELEGTYAELSDDSETGSTEIAEII